jgi:hypothetical protein
MEARGAGERKGGRKEKRRMRIKSELSGRKREMKKEVGG